MNIAGIDLGLNGCGVVIWGGKEYAFHCKRIPPAGKKSRLSYAEDMGARHDGIMEWLTCLLSSHDVRAIVYEEPTIVRVGPRVSIKSTLPQWLAYVALRGARLNLGREGRELHSIQPQAVRRLLGLPKGASKNDMVLRIRHADPALGEALYRWTQVHPAVESEHVHDAAAVLTASRFDDALCGIWRRP
jgi:hypothetical protein